MHTLFFIWLTWTTIIKLRLFSSKPTGWYVLNYCFHFSYRIIWLFRSYSRINYWIILDTHLLSLVKVFVFIVHVLATSSVTVNIYCLRCIVDFIVLLLFGTDCVDGSGSLSGGAFNQLKLVTLSIV